MALKPHPRAELFQYKIHLEGQETLNTKRDVRERETQRKHICLFAVPRRHNKLKPIKIKIKETLRQL